MCLVGRKRVKLNFIMSLVGRERVKFNYFELSLLIIVKERVKFHHVFIGEEKG